MTTHIRLAMIGLDSSHSVAFTQRFQGTGAPRIRGLRVTHCLHFPSDFQSEADQDKRQTILEGWGVEVTTDFKHAVAAVDGILLEINDPSLHWKYFQKVAALGLPIFIDKPLAKNTADAQKIIRLSTDKKLKVWESSSLRFAPALHKAIKQAGTAELANIYGAMGTAAAGSSLLWYGCHTFQMLNQIMGNNAQQVQCTEGPRGFVTIVDYSDGRRGIIESITKHGKYGGRIHGSKDIVNFACEPDVYAALMPVLRDFFKNGIVPVPLEGSLAVQKMLDAAQKSLLHHKSIPISCP